MWSGHNSNFDWMTSAEAKRRGAGWVQASLSHGAHLFVLCSLVTSATHHGLTCWHADISTCSLDVLLILDGIYRFSGCWTPFFVSEWLQVWGKPRIFLGQTHVSTLEPERYNVHLAVWWDRCAVSSMALSWKGWSCTHGVSVDSSPTNVSLSPLNELKIVEDSWR